MTATAQRPMKLLVDGGDPGAFYPVPILLKGEDYREAPDIKRIAEDLMGAHPERFGALRDQSLVYLWKRKGGMRNGDAIRGTTKKPDTLVKFFGHQPDALILIAADNCFGMTAWQMEALVFHELSHLLYDHDDDRLKVIGHDFEGFGREWELYGDWHHGLRVAHRAAVQLPLPEGDEAAE